MPTIVRLISYYGLARHIQWNIINSRKRMVFYCWRCLGKDNYRGQAVAIIESIIAYRNDRIRDGQRSHAAATIKSVCAY